MKRFLTILLMTVAFAMNVSVVNANKVTWGPNNEWTCEYTLWDTYVFNCSDGSVDCQNNYSLYYTIDGNDPTTASDKIPWGPQIHGLSNGMTLKILVVGNNGYNNNYNHIFEFSISNNECTLVTGGSDDPTPTGPAAPNISDSWSDSFTDPSHTFSITNNAGNGYDIYYRFIGDKNSDEYNTVDNLSSFTKSTDGQVKLYPDNFTNYDNFSTITLQAIAVSSSDNSKYSEIASKTFTKTTPAAQINYSNGKINVTSGDACYLTVNKDNQSYGMISNQSTSYDYNGTSAVAVYARSIKQQYLFSSKATYTNSGTQPTAKPTIIFDANAGKVTVMSADDVDASHIYYTTDGNDPTTSSNTWASAQSNGVTLSSNATIKVMAQADGKSASQVVSFTNSNLPTINCNDNEITYSNTEGYTLTYSTNGSQYNITPITSISQNTTIYLKATNSNGVTVLTNKGCTYVVPKPEIKILGHYINDEPSVYIQIQVPTKEYSIHYSTNNGTSYSKYTGPKVGFYISAKDIDDSYTVKAYATKDGQTSDVTTQTFNKTATPTYSIDGTTLTIDSPSDCGGIAYKLDNGSWTKTSLTNNQVTISELSSNSLLSFRVYQNGKLYSDLANNLPTPIFSSSLQGKSEDGKVAPFVYFGISNYGTITATEGNQVLYSFDQTNWKSTFDTKDTAPGVGCILAYASEFEGSGNTVTIYAKTVNGDNESAVVSKTYTKTDAPTVVWSSEEHSGKITITPPSTDWDEIIYSKDGGMNWSVITNDNSSTSYQIDDNYYGNAPIYVQARAINNDNAHIYSNEDCHIIGPATIGDKLAYVTKTLTNYVRINTLPRLTVKYTFDGTDPTAPESDPKQYTFPTGTDQNYVDKPIGSSLDIAENFVKVRLVATDGKGHTSTEDTQTFYKTEKPTFEDKGETFIVHGVKGTNNYDNKLYVKIGDDSDWTSTDNVDQSYDKASCSLVQASALYTEYTKLFSDPIKVVVTDKVPTFTPNLNDNKVTITGDGTVRYSTDGGGTWDEADGQTGAIVDIPVGGLTVKAYITSTGTDNGIDTYYTSNVSTGNYTYTTPLTPPTATLDDNFVKLESGDPDFEDHFQITGEAGNVVHYTFKYAETNLSGTPTGVYTTIDDGTVTLDENGQGTISNNLTDESVVFNSSIPLILEVYATKDGKTSATNTYTFVQSAKANPIENENSVSFEAKDGDVTVTGDNLKYYYHCFDYTQNTFVWSDVMNNINFTIEDYTAATSPISITTISKESGKLKAYVPQLKLQNFVKPDAPTITNNDGTVTISTDEKGTTDYPVYLIYTTDGTDPSYTVNNEVPVATSGTNTVVVNGYTTSFTISETTTVKAYVYCKDTRKYEVPYASNLATETFTIGSGWEPYGRGTFKDNYFFPNGTTMDIYVRTKEGESNIKQIKVANWESGWEVDHNVETGYRPEFIFDWDTNTGVCTVSEYYTGIYITYPTSGENHYYFIQPTVGSTNGLYDPDTDTYSINFTYYQNSEKDKSGGGGTQNSNATLKMEGMWLGDMEEKTENSAEIADQYSYMPQLSQYKIGLVKIPTDGTDTDYLDFENGVCRIVLDDNDGDGDYDEFDDFFNTTGNDDLISSTSHNWNTNSTSTEPQIEDSELHKMLDQFTITDEGAYYIVVARQVPNGDGTYSYTGAYQYMPVYYSPASNWEEVGGGKCTYQDDIVGGLYDGDYGSKPTNYTVKVEENKTTPGLYRVKNMYGSGFKENEDEENDWYSYQGESPYRENVYFYIDATDPNSVKLYNDMFYAQPLGVDWGCGEMMLVDLGFGTLTEDKINGGIDIKFNQSGSQIGKMYEWEDWSDSGYEYDGTDGFGSKTNDDASASNRFDLFIPVSTPSKTQPDAPTITYTEGSGKVTISTDEEGTTGNPVYLIYTINGDEPVLGQHYTVENGVPTAISGTNTVVVTGTSTSFYITSTTTVNAKVYCGKYTTHASDNAEDEFTIVAPAVQPKVTLINDYFTKPEDSDPDDNNYFMIKFDKDTTFDTYSIVYIFTQDGNTLYYKDGASYSSYEGTITKDTPKPSVTTRIEGSTTHTSVYNATFNPLECYINNGSSYVQAYPFDDEHPLIIKMRVKQGDSFIPGVAYSTPYTQSTAVVPEAEYNGTTEEMEVSFEAPSDGYSSTNPLTFYYRYSKKSSDVWSDRIVADEATDFTDKITYTTPSSMPGDVYTVSSQKDHLKVAYKYNITKYAKPDKPGISYDDTTPGETTVTIHTDEEGTTEHPAYLYYTTDGSEPVINGAGSDDPSVGTGTKMVELNDKSFTLTIANGGSKTVTAFVYCPNSDKYTTYESDDSIKYCPVWRDWESYGRGAWEYTTRQGIMYVYNAEHTTDIWIATDIDNPTHKRIKIDGMMEGLHNDGLGFSKIQDNYNKDFIFEWDMDGDGKICYSNYQYMGLKKDENFVWLSVTNGEHYDKNTDSYHGHTMLKIDYCSSNQEYKSLELGGNLVYAFTLKMDGLWLGDMEETTDENGKDYAIQYSYMPRNSHYKIGLVKIPEDGEDTEYLTFEDGKCFINSDIKSFFEDQDNSESFVNAVWDWNDKSYKNVIERHWDASAMNPEAQPLLDNTDSVDIHKMLDQFKITEEGAYYIVAARLVPNGESENETYSYSGAYRYMPVYYSPSSKWKTLSYDGMRTYRDDFIYGYFYMCFESDEWDDNNDWFEDQPIYSVEVQENKDNPGLFRVKNLYHKGLTGNEGENNLTSYQGESSPYRENVYFYIDTRGNEKTDGDGNKYREAKLYPSEFYAQPLGFDWESGEMMLTRLDGGKYIDGQIVFESRCDYDENSMPIYLGATAYEFDDTEQLYSGFDIIKPGNVVYADDAFPINRDYNDEYDPEEDSEDDWYDDRFKLQISTPYPLFDDTPYTTTDMNDKWPDEYKENSEDYAEKYGELAIFDEESDYYYICYTNGIENGQDHVDVTYERSLADEEGNAKDIGTLVLPVDFTPSDIPGFKFYKLNDEKTTEGQIKFDKIGDTETIEAHTPVVFKRIENTGNMSVTLYDRTVVKKDEGYNTVKGDEDAPSIRVGNWDVTGMYTYKAVTDKAIPEKYSKYVLYDTDLKHSYIVYNDKAKQVNGGLLLDPYRAYFHLNTDAQAPALISVFFDDEPVTGIDPTSGNEQRRGAEGSYNVAGQKVKSGYRGVVIENGKKRFVK